MTDLAAHLALGHGSRVAIIGGGGKTTTMNALAHSLSQAGVRTAMTTTTKIMPPTQVPLLLLDTTPDLSVALASAPQFPVCVGQRVGPEGKLLGVPVALFCDDSLWPVDVRIAEADGSLHRPLKIHAPYEPVVPPCAGHLLILAGLDAAGRTVTADTVHRLDQVARLGLQPGDPLDPAAIASVVTASLRYAPPGAATAVLLNKADTPDRIRAGETIRKILRARHPGLDVLLTVHGHPLA